MRVYSLSYLVALLAMGAVFALPGKSVAQDIFLKQDRGSTSSDGGSKKIYLTPKPGDLGKTRYTSSNNKRSLYNNAGRDHRRRAAPSTVLHRNNELDRIQQANIEGAQARAARNAEIVRQMQKKWEAERAAADEAAARERMAEKAAQDQPSAAASGEGSGKDLTNAKYLEETGKGMQAPTRTFNIFR